MARCAGQGFDVHDREISVYAMHAMHAMRDMVSVLFGAWVARRSAR